MEEAVRFADRTHVYAGVAGTPITIASADPRNYHHAITDPGGCPSREIDGVLFIPEGDHPLPCVIVVPGSLGVGPNHEMHAETLVAEGFAVCVVDPFGPRAVTSTVANQTAYSFAASAFDVLSTVRTLTDRPEIDSARIGAQGHSRGGSAVAIAATRRFADPIIGPSAGLAAAYAVYPWCGHQFLSPHIGSTRYRAVIGDQDQWCSPQQVQGHVGALVATGADASIRIFPGAHHSFDRLEPVHIVEEASVAPAAPAVWLTDDGSMIDPWSGVSDPARTDRDSFVAAIDAGFGRRGAAIGGSDDQPAAFRDDMVAFWSDALGA